MYLAWVEVRTTERQEADCGLVEKEFPGLQAAQAWASRQLSERSDATGNAAVFETAGPLVRLAWKPTPGAPGRRARRHKVEGAPVHTD